MIKELPIGSGAFNNHFFLIVAGALVWVIGGNLVIAMQFKRRGMSATEGFRLGGLLKVSLNLREIAALLGIAALAMGLVIWGATQL